MCFVLTLVLRVFRRSDESGAGYRGMTVSVRLGLRRTRGAGNENVDFPQLSASNRVVPEPVGFVSFGAVV